jgi:hypothetical protein
MIESFEILGWILLGTLILSVLAFVVAWAVETWSD